jgi:hypothetical protein
MAVSIIFVPAAANLLVSAVTVVLGAFIATSPHRAAKIWSSQRLATWLLNASSVPTRDRVFGILLWLAGVLHAVDGIVFSNHHN